MSSAESSAFWTCVDNCSQVLRDTDLWNYVWWPYPSPVDDVLSNFVRAALDDPSQCPRLRERHDLEKVAEHALSAFAQRMATLAVRESSIDRLTTGLAAVSVSQWLPHSDWRDLGGTLMVLSDAALRIHATAEPFERAAAVAPARIADLIRSHVPRSSGWRARLNLLSGKLFAPSLYRIASTPEGLQYGRPPNTTREQVERRVEGFLRKKEESERKRAASDAARKHRQ